jgi:hypothetical protein
MTSNVISRAFTLAATVVAIGLSVPHSAQANTITTPIIGGNFGNGLFFDVTNDTTNAIQIDGSFSTLILNINKSVTLNVFYKPGTYIGSIFDASAWTFLGADTITSAASSLTLNPFDVENTFSIGAGQRYGLYITAAASDPDDALAYNNGNMVGDLLATDGNLSIYQGSDLDVITSSNLFAGLVFEPRNFNGSINYTIITTPEPTSLLALLIAGGAGLLVCKRQKSEES